MAIQRVAVQRVAIQRVPIQRSGDSGFSVFCRFVVCVNSRIKLFILGYFLIVGNHLLVSYLAVFSGF